MERIYPSFYTEFKCIAGACPDSCCHEWEVQVDEASAARYRAMEGPLGDIKRSVTGLFSGEKENVPARALGFTGEANKDTVPYQITFHVTTTTNVNDVRVVDSQGQPLNTTPTANVPNTDSVLHMQTMTLENEYQGDVYLQIHDGEAWQATEYRLQLSIGADMKLKISETSSTTLTAGSTAAASAGATLTAGSNTEPTVSPAVAETGAPVQEPEATAASPAATQESTAQTSFVFVQDETATPAPEATPTATPVVTATPTPEITPTPTPVVTPTPMPLAGNDSIIVDVLTHGLWKQLGTDGDVYYQFTEDGKLLTVKVDSYTVQDGQLESDVLSGMLDRVFTDLALTTAAGIGARMVSSVRRTRRAVSCTLRPRAR